MAKQIQGECNWCGHCGCYFGQQNNNPWCPGFSYVFFDWGRQHPEEEPLLVSILKESIDWQRGDMNIAGRAQIVGLGRVDFYLSGDGLQVSAIDKSCPFFDKDTHACKIWDTQYIPYPCANIPQILDEEQIAAWQIDHPDCGYYWIDV